MSEELELLEFFESDSAQEHADAKLERKRLRDACNPFSISDTEFINRYRLSKELVQNLVEELKPHSPEPKKSTDLSLETKVLVALSFYATGSYQRPIGDKHSHCLAQPTVSAVIRQITLLLNLPQIRAKYIKFPRTEDECKTNVVRFYNKFGMPGVLGCIGCSLIAIKRPTENEKQYYCRKQYHSLNVQLICNADYEIISVDAGHGGASHNSHIWSTHPIKQHLEELTRDQSEWLLGDSEYPLSKYLMTPITNASFGTPEANYTMVHVRTRSTVERTIGLLKARFRCLLVHRILHYSPQVAGSIVNACVVLHNMCVRANLPEQALTSEEAMQEGLQQSEAAASVNIPSVSNNTELNDGLAVRRALVSQMWASRNP